MREVWITFKELVDLTVCVNHQAVAELNVEFFEISPNKEGKLVMSAGRFIGKEKFKREYLHLLYIQAIRPFHLSRRSSDY